MKKWVITLSIIAFLSYVTASIAIEGSGSGNSLTKKEDVFLESDQMDYDQTNQIVTARGKVEVQKGTNVVFADQITYNQNTNIVTAEGNVSYIGQDGNVVFTDKVVLNDDLSSGVIDFFRGKLSDGSLVAAVHAQRVDEDHMNLTKAVYSPCTICAEREYPQWQIKADKIFVDNVEQRVSYEGAYLEVYGTPVIYSPYFSHPTPNADRKSGFLVPSFRSDSNLGGALTTPYYFNIAPNTDFTLKPTFTTKEGLLLDGDFKKLLTYGHYEIEGSITRPRDFTDLTSSNPPGDNEKPMRGNLHGVGLFNITDHWDFGFNGEYTSDDTYLRRYHLDNTDQLTSRAWFDRISDRNFTRVEAVYFHGLLATDDPSTTPLVTPYVRSHVESTYGVIPGFSKSKIEFDARSFDVTRDVGADNISSSVKSTLSIPYVTDGGHIFEAETSLRADQFDFNDPTVPNKNSSSRAIPEASLGWRLPMVNNLDGDKKMLLEPITKIIATPNNNYNKNVPNEDSQDVEFSELNVFSDNRYRGIDMVENGVRAEYGLRGGYYQGNYSVDYVVGQNYRFKQALDAPVNSGILDKSSDIVGRVGTSYKDIVDLTYRFRFDQKTLAVRRDEIDLAMNYYPLRLNLNYINLDYDFITNTDNREEVSGDMKLNVTQDWSIVASGTRNLAGQSNVYAKAGLRYEGDCTDVEAVVRKDYISDRDAKSGASFDFKVGLKNLGEI